MKFGQPEYFYILLILPLIFLIEFKIRRNLSHFISSNFTKENFKKIAIRRKKSKQFLKTFLLIIVFILIIFALSKPQYGFKEIPLARSGTNIFIAIDVSRSMRAKDISPSRIEVAKRKILDFINNLKGERVSLICFAGVPFINIPLTTDYSIFKNYMDIIDTDLIPVQGTDFYKLITKVVEVVERKNLGNANLIILSDGEDFSGDIDKALKLCKKFGIKIFAIGIGGKKPVPIPLKNGGYKKNKNGNIVMTKLNEDFLKKICLETGGIYIKGVTSPKDVEIMYKKMKENFENKLIKDKKRIFINRFQWFLFPAFILLCLYFIIDERKFVAVLLLLIFSGNLNAANPSILNKKGIKSYRAKKYGKALKYFDKAYKIDKNKKFLYNKALTLYKLKKFNKSLKIFSKLTGNADKSLKEKSFFNKGVIEYKNKNYKKALEDFKNALKINPDDFQARINYELTLKKLKQKNKSNKQNKQKNHKNQNRQKKQKKQQNNRQIQQKYKKNQTKELEKLLNLYNENPEIIKKMIRRKLKSKNIPQLKDW